MQEIAMTTPSTGVRGTEEGRLVQRAVARAKQGDAEGIHFLYVRFYDDVLRYVNSLVRDYHEAEDITHNVFAKLMTAITKYEERAVPFTAWIMRVARNAALDHLRARRAVPAEEVRVTESAEADSSLERGLDIREALEELPTDQREVLVLRHVMGLSPVEIAGTLEKTESSVHGLHHRGRRALQGALESRDAVPVVTQSAA
ncbi:MAG TPA: sigma-70 family RNA polymerase sigma factor [Solirubrobacterales bacterium]|nr:sigma-70 family RNA polymerase sigma factor [Solirubrobacterales bacterium]